MLNSESSERGLPCLLMVFFIKTMSKVRELLDHSLTREPSSMCLQGSCFEQVVRTDPNENIQLECIPELTLQKQSSICPTKLLLLIEALQSVLFLLEFSILLQISHLFEFQLAKTQNVQLKMRQFLKNIQRFHLKKHFNLF